MSAFALTPEAPRLPSPYRNEAEVVNELTDSLAGDTLDWSQVVSLARPWVDQVRANPAPFWALESLMREFPITSNEGLALMRLAEALLRVPDMPTAIALTSDQLGHAEFRGSWSASVISFSKKFLPEAEGAGGIFNRLGARAVVAATVRSLHLLGRQFVLGRTIAEAIGEAGQARKRHQSLRFSFDMLGEGARTDADARRYHASYMAAISAIAATPASTDGISIKLSALCARYEVLQRKRVFAELLPRLWQLVASAAAANINLTMDAEEVDRLELSLDLLEVLAQRLSVQFPHWQGLGLAVQAYQTRAVSVIHEVSAVARRYQMFFRVRLVKGAYWDAEIKRAQELGVAAYPVFTRKQHTDVSYLACAKVLLTQADVIYPQFATHNASTIAAILCMAKAAGADYELQRLHGMGEGIYREVLKDPGVNCRVYAPVGEHRDLLAYLVRRLLENGANSSFVRQLGDSSVTPAGLLASPLTQVMAEGCLALPHDLFRNTHGQGRANSRGVDITDCYQRAPILSELDKISVPQYPQSPDTQVNYAMTQLSRAYPLWNATPVNERATVLRQAADMLEAQLPEFCALLTKEAFKTPDDGIAEVREAVDFLRYYADEAEALQPQGRGVFVCISPWNFPLAIFTGQIAAALITGNTVAAKPAEQTPFIARRMIALLYQAGVPEQALQMLHGDGERIGAALIAHSLCAGVCFTGSLQVAQIINRALAQKSGPAVPLIAETGGINAMLVDSTALPEQVVDAVVQSAFGSAGQRCSALRLLCVHDSIADQVIEMLAGAMQELSVGDPSDLATDVGPLIDDEAYDNVIAQIERLKREAVLICRSPFASAAPDELKTRVIAPIAFRIKKISEVGGEIFGPVLQVLRWQGEPEAVVAQINMLGYGLTMGIQTRIDSRAERLAACARAGNVYVNRSMTGAVVGVQPFGGEGLSGTGPKAGGPFYLRRFCAAAAIPASGLLQSNPPVVTHGGMRNQPFASRLVELKEAHRSWNVVQLERRAETISQLIKRLDLPVADMVQQFVTQAFSDFAPKILPGPTGEKNELRCRGRGVCLVMSAGAGVDVQVLTAAVVAALLAGNAVAILVDNNRESVQRLLDILLLAGVPESVVQLFDGSVESLFSDVFAVEGHNIDVLAFAHGENNSTSTVRQQLAQHCTAIVPVISADEACDPRQMYRFATEQTLTINTAAAGGNAALLGGAF